MIEKSLVPIVARTKKRVSVRSNIYVTLNDIAYVKKLGNTMDANLLAPCNIYCGNCVIYRKNKCLGCRRETEIAEARGKVFCDIFSCADSRKLVTCSDCATYLCEKYDESIFAETFIKWMREKLR